MTSRERVLTALDHREPDRVPVFLPLTMHGAAEVGMTLSDYLSSPRAVAEGQLRLRARFGADVVYTFFYAGIEHEAFGGTVEFYDDGPPNSVGALIPSIGQVGSIRPPVVSESLPLARVLRATEILRAAVADTAPILGIVMSPYSLPVLQLGFPEYLVALQEQPELVSRLIAINEAFTVAWANAQLAAGADLIGFFDPMASTTVLPRETLLRVGLPSMARTMSRISGRCLTLLASGIALPVIDDVARTPAIAVNVSASEDLGQAKAAANGRLGLIGNLNGIEMRRWSQEQAFSAVRRAIAGAAAGGGFMLSDSTGEIPAQVPDHVLHSIVAAAHEYGRYPIADSVLLPGSPTGGMLRWPD